MSVSRSTPLALAAVLAGLLVLAASALSATARAEGLEWRLEQPKPPPLESGVQSEIPIGLGRIGDIEFWAPNKGLLITDGNGTTVRPGVWVYNGEGWHELANVCGATDGRIAWAGPDEFWTISDGRAGQAANGQDILPPLEDNTLCRFAYNTATQKLEVVDSYATLAFQASSYQAMDSAACASSTDCWFAGGPLPFPQQGAFQLHWTGSSLEAEPNTNRRVETVEDMRDHQGRLYESIALPLVEQAGEEEPEEILHPSVLQELPPEGGTAFTELHPKSETNRILPEYVPKSTEFRAGAFPQALEGLRLSVDEDSLWAAAGPVAKPPAESAPAELTVLRESDGVWSQVLGPEGTVEAGAGGSGKVVPANLADEVVNSIAAEPGASEEAWLALDTRTDVKNPNPQESALVVHLAANGSLSEETLPSVAEKGVGPKGAAAKIVCPAQNDCWMATTQGWLFHLSTKEAREHPEANGEPAFSGGYLITYRPLDKGVPQEPSNTLPIDDSGLEESGPPSTAQLVKATTPSPFVSVSVPLLSDVHSRLIHGSTLELSFRLAVKASVRLLAKRHAKIVASTPTRILTAGKRSLQLKLNPARWPTKLSLETHALAPLPTVSSLSSGVETVSTSLAFPNALGISGWGPSL